MKYLKTYEGLFDFFKKKKKNEIDLDTLTDLLTSDLEDFEIDGVEILPFIEYDPVKYVVTSNGDPYLSEFNFHEPHHLSNLAFKSAFGIILNRKLSGINDKTNRGYLLKFKTMQWENVVGIVSGDKLMNKINKNRMNEYGIGYSFYRDDDYSSVSGILFYPKTINHD